MRGSYDRPSRCRRPTPSLLRPGSMRRPVELPQGQSWRTWPPLPWRCATPHSPAPRPVAPTPGSIIPTSIPNSGSACSPSTTPAEPPEGGAGRSRPRVPCPAVSSNDPASDLATRDRGRVWHPYAPMPAAMPAVPVVGASGSTLQLADGREVVDGMSSWWAAIHGYRHPVLDDAVRAQLDAMAHVMFGGIDPRPGGRAARSDWSTCLPPGLEHVFLADSGSVSVEVAIKMALQYARGTGRPERTRLLTVRNGYHGDTLGACRCVIRSTACTRCSRACCPADLRPGPEPAYGEPFEPAHIADVSTTAGRHAARGGGGDPRTGGAGRRRHALLLAGLPRRRPPTVRRARRAADRR